jgi:hypothetical protein
MKAKLILESGGERVELEVEPYDGDLTPELLGHQLNLVADCKDADEEQAEKFIRLWLREG